MAKPRRSKKKQSKISKKRFIIILIYFVSKMDDLKHIIETMWLSKMFHLIGIESGKIDQISWKIVIFEKISMSKHFFACIMG